MGRHGGRPSRNERLDRARRLHRKKWVVVPLNQWKNVNTMAAPKKLRIIVAFAALYLIWGSTYLGILVAIQSIPPFLMAGARFFLAGLIMYTVVRLRGTPKPEWVTWRSAMIIGACLLLCGNGGVTISEKWVPTGLASLLVATVPIDIALLSWMTGTAPRPPTMACAGLIGGFVGVGLLVGPAFRSSPDISHNHLALGMSILLVASLIWSIGSLYSRRAKSSPSLFLAAGQQMICGGALLILTGLGLGEHRGFDAGRVTWSSIGAFLYLVLIGALVGYTAYFYLLRHCDPAKVATYAYVNPVVAILLGTAFADEQLTFRTMLGAALIIGSVAIVITAQQMQPKSTAQVAAVVAGADCAR
jgi:drug/metabolite transporter (DMT)-like permease